MSYILSPWLRLWNTDFALKYCLFGSEKLTKNANRDKYKHSGSSMGFDSRSEISFTDGTMGKIVIVFWADMSSSVHIDNKNNILIFSEGPIQWLHDTTLTAEANNPVNCAQPNKRIILSLY